MKYCPKCEAKLIEGLKYCFHCGVEVSKVKDTKQKKQDKKCKPKSRLDTRLFDIV